MVGHEVSAPVRVASTQEAARERLSVQQISAADDRGVPALRDVSFGARGGEIVGIAGVEGNGQRELLEVLIGTRAVTNGDVVMDGERVTHLRCRARRARGLAFIPEDRNREGLSRDMTLAENLIATGYFRTPMSRLGFLALGAIRDGANSLIRQFDVRAAGEGVNAGTLSGGNAQKVVIARELGAQPGVLIAAQPTRGLDIGAAQFVQEQLLRLRAAGAAIVLISADLDELLAISDRIAVLFGGRILTMIDAARATRETLGLAMAGRIEGEAAR
jgi:simple sugar transport system ATP-binding protein